MNIIRASLIQLNEAKISNCDAMEVYKDKLHIMKRLQKMFKKKKNVKADFIQEMLKTKIMDCERNIKQYELSNSVVAEAIILLNEYECYPEMRFGPSHTATGTGLFRELTKPRF